MLRNRTLLLGILAGAGIAALAAVFVLGRTGSTPEPFGQSNGPQCCADGGASESASVTLDPALFRGPVREAYQIAAQDPALLAQLHCYCGCDRTDGHQNLLDCFRDKHGATCAICIAEAREARVLADQGVSIDEIRDIFRARYASQH
jgi:hypothetical protein